MSYKKYQIIAEQGSFSTRKETNDYSQLKDIKEDLKNSGFDKVLIFELPNWMQLSEDISYEAIKSHGEKISL